MKFHITFLALWLTTFSFSQNKTEYVSKTEIKNDLKFLDSILQNDSSYQGLNGYDYKKDFEEFSANVSDQGISISDFGLFLSKSIGKIGDRHSSIKGYDLPESLYFPISFAPHNGKVLALKRNKATKTYGFWDSEFPYIETINKININDILSQSLPGEALAPKKSYLLRSIRDLRDIETVFSIIGKELPNPLQISLSNKKALKKL